MINLEKSHVIKRKETKEDGANNTTEWDSAKAVSRVVGMRAFAIISGDEQFPLRDDDVDFAGSVFFWTVCLRDAGVIIGMEAIWIFLIVNGEDAIFHGYTLFWKGDDALNNILIIYATLDLTSQGAIRGAVRKDDNLATRGDIFVTKEMFPSDRETIDDYAVALVKSVFHGNSNDVIRAKNLSIEAESPDDNSNYEENKAQDIFCERMFFK